MDAERFSREGLGCYRAYLKSIISCFVNPLRKQPSKPAEVRTNRYFKLNKFVFEEKHFRKTNSSEDKLGRYLWCAVQ